jgi:hypothetical protein
MPVEPDLNLFGAALYAKSSFSDVDTVTSPALSFHHLEIPRPQPRLAVLGIRERGEDAAMRTYCE